MPPPEAVLTELVIMTLLAAVAEAHHALGVAVGALDRVKDCGGERGNKGSDTNRCDGQKPKVYNVRSEGSLSTNLRADVHWH